MSKIKTSPSGYFYVYYQQAVKGDKKWEAKINNTKIKYNCWFMTEKEAAIAIDKVLIKNQYEPVNVLKRK
jgi:hypothetical protein